MEVIFGQTVSYRIPGGKVFRLQPHYTGPRGGIGFRLAWYAGGKPRTLWCDWYYGHWPRCGMMR